MSAGAGTKAYQDAVTLEWLLSAAFGPDFREKSLRLPYGSWSLRDAFEECGLRDPRALAAPSSGACGLWHAMPATHMLAGAQRTPKEQVRVGLERLRREYGYPGRWRRYAWGSTSWPLSPAPRSAHGDPLR